MVSAGIGATSPPETIEAAADAAVWLMLFSRSASCGARPARCSAPQKPKASRPGGDRHVERPADLEPAVDVAGGEHRADDEPGHHRAQGQLARLAACRSCRCLWSPVAFHAPWPQRLKHHGRSGNPRIAALARDLTGCGAFPMSARRSSQNVRDRSHRNPAPSRRKRQRLAVRGGAQDRRPAEESSRRTRSSSRPATAPRACRTSAPSARWRAPPWCATPSACSPRTRSRPG